jgi:hypothetical protein
MKTLELLHDANGAIIPVMDLSAPHNVDGTAASAQSNVIDGKMLRICATGGDIHFLIGVNPVALATSHFLGDHQEIWMPCNMGDKVAVLGGIANIATVGV